MSETLTPAISQRICQHMNEDHADALRLYAQVLGQKPQTETAQMLAIDSQGMELEIESQGQKERISIPFDHTLQDAEDAHQTLIALVKLARKA